MMLKIVITGAGGFLGTHLSRMLVQDGNKVFGVLRNMAGSRCVPGVNYLEGDLANHDIWKSLEEIRPDCLMHLAAVVPETLTGENAGSAASINRRMDDLTIEFCERSKSRLIYAGGTIVYGLSFSGMKSESSDVDPIGRYAAEKHCTERRMMTSLALRDPASLRISAPYGPGQKAGTVIRIFAERALQNRPLLYHGTGMRTQEFTYVSDVADAFRASMRCRSGGIFNITGGEPVSMKDLARMIVTLASSSSEIRASGHDDPQEDFRGHYDTSLARKHLSWTPEIHLEEGLGRYIDFMRMSR